MAQGRVAEGFEEVAHTLDEILGAGVEAGVACAATVDGEPVVDVWGGDAGPGRPWTEDTIVTVFSTTKGAAALCAQLLWDRGLLDLDAPIARYWPEFAAGGKQDALVWHALSHTLGMPVIPGFEELMEQGGRELADPEALATRIASGTLSWEPGTKARYHALSYGVILGELVRRIDGRTLGTFFREEIAEPNGIDFWIGLPPELHHRVADLRPGDVLQVTPEMPEAEARFLRPLRNLPSILEQPWMRSAELPAGGGIGSAAALARMYSSLATDGRIDGRPVVSPRSIDVFSTVRFEGEQEEVGTPMRQCLGYAAFASDAEALGISDRAFGHAGAGGSFAMADPTHRLSFAIVKNQMTADAAAGSSLVKSVYDCLRDRS